MYLINGLYIIGIGGEAVVDYSFRFKKEYNRQTTWVCGYANELVDIFHQALKASLGRRGLRRGTTSG